MGSMAPGGMSEEPRPVKVPEPLPQPVEQQPFASKFGRVVKKPKRYIESC